MPTDLEYRLDGKLPAEHDPKAKQFAKYLTLPAAPPAVNWADKVKHLGEMLNNRLGDCTCAAAGHLIQMWTYDNGNMVIVPDSEIRKTYSAVSGYNPETGANDNGAVERTVLAYWQQTGVGGHKIYMSLPLEPGNHEHIKASTYLFGGAYIGFQIPAFAKEQMRQGAGGTFSIVAGGDKTILGGHAVPVVGYNSHVVAIITWGTIMYMTWEFWDAYCDEAYAVLSTDWAPLNEKAAPDGFNLRQLYYDLEDLK